MSRLRSIWIANEVPAIVAGLALVAVSAIVGVVYLWLHVGGNVAGWSTMFQ